MACCSMPKLKGLFPQVRTHETAFEACVMYIVILYDILVHIVQMGMGWGVVQVCLCTNTWCVFN